MSNNHLDRFLQLGGPIDPIRAERAMSVQRLGKLKPTSVRWLWPGRIPLGRITLLVGDPGIGKSLLTLDIAARVSSGKPWPDAAERQGEKESGRQGEAPPTPPSLSPCLPLSLSSPPVQGSQTREPASVLLFTSEDDLTDTILPRLHALGADRDRILAVTYLADQESGRDLPRAFCINRDIGRLTNLLSAHQDCRLIIIDPVSAYLGGASEFSNAQIQAVLTPLAQLAHVRNIAVILVSHLRKKAGDAIHRTMGSLAFVSLARSAWTIVKDPENANRRYFLPIKNNIAADTNGLAYTIEQAPHRNVPTMRWSPDPVTITADTIFTATRPGGRPDDERQQAIQWLKQFLTAGPVPTTEVKRAAEAHGFSYGTLRRAYRQLGAEAVPQPGTSYKTWAWRLPELVAQNPEGEFCATVFSHPPTEPESSKTSLPTIETPPLPILEDDTATVAELLRKVHEEDEKLMATLRQSTELPISSTLFPSTPSPAPTSTS